VTDVIVDGCGCAAEAVSLVFEDVDKREWYRDRVTQFLASLFSF